MRPYLQTFRRHRLAYLLPVLLGCAIAGWVALAAPARYASDTALWVDTSPTTDVAPAQSTDASGAVVTPAAQAQMLLGELLATREFRMRVGREGPLAAYLARHGSTGWSPSALIASLRARPSLDDRVVAALGSGVTSKVVGPQLLAITLTGPGASVASSTLRALIAEFDRASEAARSRRGAVAVAYYRDQVVGAEKSLLAAHTQVDQYLVAHPTLKPCSTPASATALDAATGCTDLRLRALTDADRAASARLLDATGNLNQASIDLASLPAAGAPFRIVDAPTPPPAPLPRTKKAVGEVLAGALAGGLVSVLIISAATALGRTGLPALPRGGPDLRRVAHAGYGDGDAGLVEQDAQRPPGADLHSRLAATGIDSS